MKFMNQLLTKLVNCIKYQADEKSATDLQHFLSEHKERLSAEHKRAKANADTVEDRYLDLCDDLPLYSVRIHEREIECAGLISNLEYCNKEFWSTLLCEQSKNFNLKLIHSTSSFFDEVQRLERTIESADLKICCCIEGYKNVDKISLCAGLLLAGLSK